MIKSMTGYGAARIETSVAITNAEVKTLNAKFLDISLRLPKELAEKEIEVRNLVSEQLNRGKVSLSIEVNRPISEETSLIVNEELFSIYFNKLSALADQVGSHKEDVFKTALAYPDVVTSNQNTLSEEIWLQTKKSISEALNKCDEFRAQEGHALQVKLRGYIESIRSNFEKATELDPGRIENIKHRIKTNLEEFIAIDKIDQNRFEQEIIYYIEKIDITEEKVRLNNHLTYFLKTLDEKGAIGKKLGFISQEIGREINTIGSKANDAGIQKYVVLMKDGLEKIKEQSLNIL